MLKLRSLTAIPLLAAFRVATQSPEELLIKIQSSKPDTIRISLLLKLADYYLSKSDGQYQSDDIKTIDIATYIHKLLQSLEDNFGTSGHILFILNGEPINLSLSHAIPLGLIINEAITNSIKYAFPGNGKGEIAISMTHDGRNITLELADNGIGMPQVGYDSEPKSLGLRLIKGLSEDINAETHFEVNNGTKITITFKLDPVNDTESTLILTDQMEVYI